MILSKVIRPTVAILLLLSLLSACNPTASEKDDWEKESVFNHKVRYDESGTGVYKMVGKEGRIGFTPVEITENHGGKHMWFYWGEEDILDKPVKITAVKKGSDEPIDVFEGQFYKDAQVSKDSVNMPSNLVLPSAGLWKIFIHIDGKLYDTLVVDVAKQSQAHPETKRLTPS